MDIEFTQLLYDTVIMIILLIITGSPSPSPSPELGKLIVKWNLSIKDL